MRAAGAAVFGLVPPPTDDGAGPGDEDELFVLPSHGRREEACACVINQVTQGERYGGGTEGAKVQRVGGLCEPVAATGQMCLEMCVCVCVCVCVC